MAAIGEEAGQSRQLGLCDLPDEILIRILSLLPTEDAVRTCLLVLRTGQHHLWKSLTSLQFHEDDHFDRTLGSIRTEQHHLWKSLTSLQFHEYFDRRRIRRRQFYKFVDRVIHLRDHSVPLVSFSLQCYVELEDHLNHIKIWITKAVEWNVEELTLSICLPHFIDVTMANTTFCCIFGCQSLVKLVLNFTLSLSKLNLNVPSSAICLPRLKYLILGGVQFHGVELTKLLSSPLLEELTIDDCPRMFVGSIRVCSPKLQVLKIYGDHEYQDSGKICIIADNLKYFTYLGNLRNEYRICASSSTQLSKVELWVNELGVNEDMPKDCALNCYNILKGLSGTRNLALSNYFLKGIEDSSELLDKIPIFQCLTRLDIRVYEEMNWICIDSLTLMKIYERCPHLEYLNIGNLGRAAVGSLQLSPIPLCFRSHLKKILIYYYVPGDYKADAAIDVLLNSAFVLEELVIYCRSHVVMGFHEDGRKIQELRDWLNRRPRVSKDCIISVRGEDDIETIFSGRKSCDEYYLQSLKES